MIEYTETYKEFSAWLKKAKSGDNFVYYTGDCLANDINTAVMGKHIWKCACEGKVYLFQRKLGTNSFAYTAQKASIVNPKLNPAFSIENKRVYQRRSDLSEPV